MRTPRRPYELKLLDGLKWFGKLRLHERGADGRYFVAFDAEIRNPAPGTFGVIVYDQGWMTAEQLKAWTGWEEGT